MTSSRGYLRGLDGLRALALGGVLLFHADELGGGFLGVDLFFVLSGFLITTLLVQEWEASGTIDLRSFWARRIRRLLPAALVVLLATSAYAAIALDPGALHRFRGDALAALLNVANWRSISAGRDYWASFGAPSPVRHLWSISVEEQLYLVWPAVLAVTLRWGRVRLALTVAVGLGLASAVAMALLVGPGDTNRSYYGTDTRAFALLFGAAGALLLALVGDAGRERLRRALVPGSLVGAAVLAVGWTWADGADPALYRGPFPLLSFAALLVIGGVATGSLPRVVDGLEATPLRVVGRLSYGAYLWHWLVYLILDEPVFGSAWLLLFVRVVVTLGLAFASAALVELPIRWGGALRTPVWRWAAPVGVVLVGLGIGASTLGAAAPRATSSAAAPDGEAAGPAVLLVGDSEVHGLSLAGAAALGPDVRFGYDTRVGCGIGPGLALGEGDVPIAQDIDGRPCEAAVDGMVESIEQFDPTVVVVHEGAWDVLDRIVDGEVIRFGTAAWDEAVRSNAEAVLRRFAATGARVVVLAAPCFPSGGAGGGSEIRDDVRRVERWNDLVRDAASATGATVLPYDELFCGVARTRQPDRGTDGVHLTEEGSARVWRWLLPRLELDR